MKRHRSKREGSLLKLKQGKNGEMKWMVHIHTTGRWCTANNKMPTIKPCAEYVKDRIERGATPTEIASTSTSTSTPKRCYWALASKSKQIGYTQTSRLKQNPNKQSLSPTRKKVHSRKSSNPDLRWFLCFVLLAPDGRFVHDIQEWMVFIRLCATLWMLV